MSCAALSSLSFPVMFIDVPENTTSLSGWEFYSKMAKDNSGVQTDVTVQSDDTETEFHESELQCVDTDNLPFDEMLMNFPEISVDWADTNSLLQPLLWTHKDNNSPPDDYHILEDIIEILYNASFMWCLCGHRHIIKTSHFTVFCLFYHHFISITTSYVEIRLCILQDCLRCNVLIT